MDTSIICEKMIDYFEFEVKCAENAINRKLGIPLEIIDNAEWRMVGAATICQYLGVKYLTVEENYVIYKEKLEKLL